MAKLQVQESAGAREFEIVDQETHIGRELDNALRVADPSVSRHHCVIRQMSKGYEIADLQSSNGVLVNGNRVQSSLIKDGDRITLGQVQLTFLDPVASATVAIVANDPVALGTVRMNAEEMAKIQAVPEPPKTEPVKTPESFPVPPPPPFAAPPAPIPVVQPPPPPPPPSFEAGQATMQAPAGPPPPPPGFGQFTYPGDQPMANTINKPDANPILAAVLTWFIFGCGHLVVNGQQRKWIYTLIASFVGSILCCLPGVFISILSIIDAYQTAERLQAGETIPENEYSQPLLFKIISMIDKEATCSRA